MGDKDNDGIPEWKDISKVCGLSGKRNKVILGIVIYQGLKRVELEKTVAICGGFFCLQLAKFF